MVIMSTEGEEVVLRYSHLHKTAMVEMKRASFRCV